MMDVYSGLVHDPLARMAHVVVHLEITLGSSPLSTGECKRAASVMNIIKTSFHKGHCMNR